MRILLADDNEANRIIAASILEREGHIVVTANNGEKALVECEGVKFDLILLDILMPTLDGIKTLRRLRRSDSRNKNTPVFALTAYSSASDQRQYRQVGFEFVLPKPLRTKDVERAWSHYQNNTAVPSETQALNLSQRHNTNALIDMKHWRQITKNSPQTEIFSLVERFWESTYGCINVINNNKGLASQSIPENLSKLRSAAHTLKGSAATIALKELELRSAELQNAPPENIQSSTNHLKDVISRSQNLHRALLTLEH